MKQVTDHWFMPDRQAFYKAIAGSLLSILMLFNGYAQKSNAPNPKSDASEKLKKMTGEWEVTMSLRPLPDAEEIVVKGIMAERSMIGDYCLNEIMHPAPGATVPYFQRISDLAYNVNEQRWDYISIDTRITAGVMYFSYLGTKGDTIVSNLISFPHPGFGPGGKGRGQAVYARNEIITLNDDHTIVKQYWRISDQPEWLATMYDYERHRR